MKTIKKLKRDNTDFSKRMLGIASQTNSPCFLNLFTAQLFLQFEAFVNITYFNTDNDWECSFDKTMRKTINFEVNFAIITY